MPSNDRPLAHEQTIEFDKLVSLDKPSVLALGLYGAESIRRSRMAIFMVDVLGRVQLMSPSAVQVLVPPRLSDEELDGLEEDRAIEFMAAQGDSDDKVIEYLKGRRRRGHGGEGL